MPGKPSCVHLPAPSFGLNGATTGPADVATDVRVAAAAGYQWVEVRDAKLEAYLAAGRPLAALRDLARRAGVRVLSVNALEDATLHTGRALEARRARMALLCQWAAALEAPYVVVVPSPLPAGGLPEARVRALTVAALRAYATVAHAHGVQVGFEFLGVPTCSVSTLRAARTVLAELDDPRVGLVVDAFHFYVGGSRLEDLDGLRGHDVFIVHLDDAPDDAPSRLTDAQRLLPGDGALPLQPLVARLQALGYRGAYSLELFRPEYWRWEPEVLARRGLAAMQALFAPGAHGSPA
jgi:2-keto-myo-inositol isomerase